VDTLRDYISCCRVVIQRRAGSPDESKIKQTEYRAFPHGDEYSDLYLEKPLITERFAGSEA
jgi:hypothetical protein